MDIQELAASIIADARRESARIDADANEQATRLESETERILRERRERMLTGARRRRDAVVRCETAKAERAARLAVASCKLELIDEVFARARDRLAATRGGARKALLARFFATARRSLAIASVTAARQDAATLRRMGVRVRGTAAGIGGFIAHGTDGRVTIDLRFETVLEQLRPTLTGEIAIILFSRRRSR